MIVNDRTVNLSWAVGAQARTFVVLTSSVPSSALTTTTTDPTSFALAPAFEPRGARKAGVDIVFTKTAGTGTWPVAWTLAKIEAVWGATIGSARSKIYIKDEGAGLPGPFIFGVGTAGATRDVNIGLAQMLTDTVGKTGGVTLGFASLSTIVMPPPAVAYILSFTPSTTAPTNTHTIQARILEWVE